MGFDLVDAYKHECQTANGKHHARILTSVRKDDKFPIVAILDDKEIKLYTSDGRVKPSEGDRKGLDLVTTGASK